MRLTTGVERAHLLLDVFGRVGEEDRVAQALGHLVLAVGADESADAPDERAWDREDASLGEVLLVLRMRVDAGVRPVEAARDLAAHLDVGGLIFTDRDEIRAEGEDVGTLTDRVEWKAEAVVIAEVLLFDLRLQRRVAHDPVEGKQHREVPGELGDRRDLGLHDERGALRVDPRRQPVLDDLERVSRMSAGQLRTGREGMHVREQEEALVVVLERDAILQRADPVAEVKPAGGGIAGEDARTLVHEMLQGMTGPNDDRRRTVHRRPPATAPRQEACSSSR